MSEAPLENTRDNQNHDQTNPRTLPSHLDMEYVGQGEIGESIP